jgi:hypothetical protein
MINRWAYFKCGLIIASPFENVTTRHYKFIFFLIQHRVGKNSLFTFSCTVSRCVKLNYKLVSHCQAACGVRTPQLLDRLETNGSGAPTIDPRTINFSQFSSLSNLVTSLFSFSSFSKKKGKKCSPCLYYLLFFFFSSSSSS